MSNSTTKWTASVDATSVSGTIKVAVDGATAEEIKLKGVCYSPCPINGSNNNAPAIGDWFWNGYSGTGYTINDWSALWDRDLPNIRALGANCMRVYNITSRQMNTNGTYPSQWNSGHLFEHTDFLDKCWNNGENPLYVLVGIALPQAMYWKGQYSADSDLTKFWNGVVSETTEKLGTHPAVMGFVILNELDSSVVTYGPNTSNVEFWWSQVESIAKVAKTNAPDKLVGISVHDDPNICGQAASYMANCPSVDFWGVNTYQPQSFSSVFGTTPSGPGYGGLTGNALKPVIITEYGFPTTTRPNACKPEGITQDSTSIQNVATVLDTMIPKAYTDYAINTGLFYFEYCDERWNQSCYTISSCGSGQLCPPNIYTMYGGPTAAGFPNGYWDQDGFGMYTTARGEGLKDSDPIWAQNGSVQGPATPIDTVTAKSAVVTAVTNAFSNVEAEA